MRSRNPSSTVDDPLALQGLRGELAGIVSLESINIYFHTFWKVVWNIIR